MLKFRIMKNLRYIESLDCWLSLKEDSTRWSFNVYPKETSCFPVIKGSVNKDKNISILQKSVGFSPSKIQRLKEELKRII